jgi:hypothetical protein
MQPSAFSVYLKRAAVAQDGIYGGWYLTIDLYKY